jgi:short-subunit dehydrogenase
MNILITGASQGIGYEITKKLATDKGNKIIALSRNFSKLNKLKVDCSRTFGHENVFPVSFDLASDDIKKGLLPLIKRHFKTIDIIINNAGFLVNKPFEKQTIKDIENQIDINYKAPLLLVQTLLPLFHGAGHIVNISSMGGFQGSSKFPGLSVYGSTKAAVASLTEALAEELNEKGISVNCLALGAVQTEMLADAFPGFKAPLTPAEMAEFIGYFATKGNKFFNGKILPVSLSTP